MQNVEPIIFSAGKTVYGIRVDKNSYTGALSYVAYRFDLEGETETSSRHRYTYTMTMKRWKTLEVALMRYSVKGIVCFPIFGQRPDSICENEILRLMEVGFGKMLENCRFATY